PAVVVTLGKVTAGTVGSVRPGSVNPSLSAPPARSAARSATRGASTRAAAILAALARVAPVTSGKRAATVGQYLSLCPNTTTSPKHRESYRNGAMDPSMTVR